MWSILGGAMTAAPVPVPPDPDPPAPRPRGALARVARRTLGKAWDDGIFSMAAQAAFWQALSLPPLFLGLLGSLGYVGGWFGPETVDIVEGKIVGFARRVFTPEVVDQLIAPTASSILTRGRADVVSVGFLNAALDQPAGRRIQRWSRRPGLQAQPADGRPTRSRGGARADPALRWDPRLTARTRPGPIRPPGHRAAAHSLGSGSPWRHGPGHDIKR